jgi:hypothetical protein
MTGAADRENATLTSYKLILIMRATLKIILDIDDAEIRRVLVPLLEGKKTASIPQTTNKLLSVELRQAPASLGGRGSHGLRRQHND